MDRLSPILQCGDISDTTHRRLLTCLIALEKIAAGCSDVILSQNREDMDSAVRTRICHPEKIKHLGSCREAVKHGYNGLLVPLGDVQALAAAILELLLDREKARRMGEEGRRMALQHFDERLVFERVKAEYRRLLREKGLPWPEPRSSITGVPS